MPDDVILKYTVHDEEAERSHSKWREFLGEVFYGHEVGLIEDAPIRGTLEKRFVASMGFSRHIANAHSIHRTNLLVKTDKVEQHAFVFPLSGEFECRQRGAETTVRQGDFYILNAAVPFDVRCGHGTSSVAVTIPSDLCRNTFSGIDDRFCRVQTDSGFLVRTLSCLMYGLMDHDKDVDALRIEQTVIDLIYTILDPRRDAGSGADWITAESAGHVLLKTLRRQIAHRLQDPDYRVDDAAAACGVSVRNLQGALKRLGSTFSKELANARLSRAAELLRSPSRGKKPVGLIASECGFRSQAHFSTRYREHFRISPKDERATDRETNT